MKETEQSAAVVTVNPTINIRQGLESLQCLGSQVRAGVQILHLVVMSYVLLNECDLVSLGYQFFISKNGEIMEDDP